MKPLILTYTGRRVNPLELRADDVSIEDVAHALACTNRFCGHAAEPISVAQHSVYVSKLCQQHALQGLLHDASEAYISDIARPVKMTAAFAEYRVLEDMIQATIYQKYGCATEMTPEVREADDLMLRYEGERAFGKAWCDWCTLPGTLPRVTREEAARVGRWGFWDWQYAEAEFLATARFLGA